MTSVRPGVCTILVNSESSVASGMLAGRHRDSVSSPELCSLRRAISSATSFRIGSSPGLISTKTLMPYFEIVSAVMPGTSTASTSLPKMRFISGRPVGWTCQTPERSGRPSFVRGAGALKFTLPSLRRGSPGVG
jgi:hypothetical protein